MTDQRRVVMLAFPGCQVLDVTGPWQMFAGANEVLGRDACALTLAAPATGPFRTNGGLTLHADRGFADLTPFGPGDTVIAVGGDEGVRAALRDGTVTRLIADAHAAGARVVSVCTGTFFLAAAGVLDGRRAATHWDAAARLRRFRPAVDVDPDSIYVRDGDVWTSAGVTAGIDLALALIEADWGRAVALAVARRHVVFPIRPGGQAQFAEGLAAQTAADPRLARLAERVAADPHADWRTEALADTAGVSPRSLSRLFRRELDVSPAEFVERVRVDAARRALEKSGARIEQIALACGFGSARRMDRAFARIIAATPGDYRSRFKSRGDSQ
jgi:transcriptional regulator GlxA family with amidase domain